MKIILLDKIFKLGNVSDQIEVKNGYARNFLIPQGKAMLATRKNVESFKIYYDEIQNKIKKHQIKILEKVQKIKKLDGITILSKASKTGKLFGSIGVNDIIKNISNFGIILNKNEIFLPTGVLRTIGIHIINIKIEKTISINMEVTIKARK